MRTLPLIAHGVESEDIHPRADERDPALREAPGEQGDRKRRAAGPHPQRAQYLSGEDREQDAVGIIGIYDWMR